MFLLTRAGDIELNPGPTQLVNVLTYNVNGGLQLPKKQKSLINKCLRRKNVNIFMFQETHLIKANEFVLKARWPHQFIASHGDNTSAGVLILFKKDDWDEVLYEWSDENGRMCLIVLNKAGQLYAFINVYAHNNFEANSNFFDLISHKIDHINDLFPNIDIIIGGDFNVTLSLQDCIDRLRPSTEIALANKLKSILDKHSLIDCKYNMFSELTMPTFKRGTTMSRLDYFFLSHNLIQDVRQYNHDWGYDLLLI